MVVIIRQSQVGRKGKKEECLQGVLEGVCFGVVVKTVPCRLEFVCGSMHPLQKLLAQIALDSQITFSRTTEYECWWII